MDLSTAFAALKARAPFVPEIALVLGSGLGQLAHCQEAQAGTPIPFTEIPGFPQQTVLGHAGKMLFCELEGRKVLLQAGRFHFYEGNPMALVTAPMRLYGRLGVQAVLHTNAAGAVNWNYKVGELMVLSDHINLQGTNALIGPNIEPGPRFQDMTEAYDKGLRAQIHAAATATGQRLQEGVYLAVTGPSFETPAEIRAFRSWGADAVGMSTVPETILARHAKMRVLALSMFTNMAAGMSAEDLSHAHTMATARTGSDAAVRLLEAAVAALNI
jgi:purine-nucleoside phosphorylase